MRIGGTRSGVFPIVRVEKRTRRSASLRIGCDRALTALAINCREAQQERFELRVVFVFGQRGFTFP